MSSITRLVILGAVHQFQPVPGYFIRRELSTWHVDEWANIQPGSIYNALRTLERDGYVVVTGLESSSGRPDRNLYSVTDEGRVELLRMVREWLWNVSAFDTRAPMVISSFMTILSRQEVCAALGHRVGTIEAVIAENDFQIEDTARSESTPDYVREIFELSSARLRGEQEWSRAMLERLQGGAYAFADEPSPTIRRTGLDRQPD